MTGKEQLLAVTAGVHFVEIDGTGIQQARTYKDKDTGLMKPLPASQTAFLWQGSRYPIQISVDVPEGRSPYRPGLYVLTGGIFEAGKFGRPQFRGMWDMELLPIADAIQALTDLAASENPKPAVKAA